MGISRMETFGFMGFIAGLAAEIHFRQGDPLDFLLFCGGGTAIGVALGYLTRRHV